MRILRLSIIIWRNVSHISLWTEFPARRTMSSAPYLPWTEFPARRTMSSAPYLPWTECPACSTMSSAPYFPLTEFQILETFLGDLLYQSIWDSSQGYLSTWKDKKKSLNGPCPARFVLLSRTRFFFRSGPNNFLTAFCPSSLLYFWS